MISIGSTLAGYGEIGQIGTQALALARQSAGLTAQAASGLITPNVADLGSTTRTVLNLQPELAQVNAWTSNITVAGAGLQVTQSALSGISSIAQSLTSALQGMVGASPTDLATEITSAKAEAAGALGQLTSLLNTQVGDVYVFAGTDSTKPPVPDSNGLTSGSLFSVIGNAVGSLATSGASATLSSILSASGATAPGSPFSASLSTTPVIAATQSVSVIIGAGQSVTTGVAATSGGAASSTSTGSPVRDLVAALSAVANLTTADATNSGMSDFLSGLKSLTANAGTSLLGTASELGASQDLLSSAQQVYAMTSTALSTQIGSLTSADPATVSTQMIATNNQLQASYQLIADLKGLSLASFL